MFLTFNLICVAHHRHLLVQLIPLNYKTVTVTVIRINSGIFFKTVIFRREAGPAHLKKIITVITTLQSCN